MIIASNKLQLDIKMTIFKNYLERADSISKLIPAALFDDAPDPMYITDLEEFRFLMVNKAFREATGYDVNEVLGKNWNELKMVPEHLHKPMFKWVTARIRGQENDPGLEIEVKVKDGRHLPFELKGTVLQLTPNLRGLLVQAREVTNRKRLQESLLRSERLQTVLLLGQTLRHEIYNALVPILTFSELISQDTELDESLRQRMVTINRKGQLIKNAVERLSTMSGDITLNHSLGTPIIDLYKKE